MENNRVTLNKMKVAQTGVVVELQGGSRMLSKLSTLGIRIGGKIKKISQQAMGGPAVVVIGRSQVAIGSGMAARILVEVEEEKEKHEDSSNGQSKCG